MSHEWLISSAKWGILPMFSGQTRKILKVELELLFIAMRSLFIYYYLLRYFIIIRALTCLGPSIRTSSLMKKIDTVHGCYAR